MRTERHEDRALHVDVTESVLQLIVSFTGVSDARDPAVFLEPILDKALNTASTGSKLMVMDFRRLDRMNSSSVPPVLRVLRTAQRGDLRLKLLYDRALRWQVMSFAALKAFETRDGRIMIVPA